MAVTLLDQETQIRNTAPIALYDDTVVPTVANYETNPVSLKDDLNSLRSQLQNFLNRSGAGFPAGNWYADITAPSTFENGTQRGINAQNQQLHDLERKRVLVTVSNLIDVTVTAAQNWEMLLIGELPSNTTAAVGAVATRGTVAAFNAGFDAFSLAEVSGTTAISPKNLCEVVDGATRDPIISGGRVVFALFQTETATDGHTMTGTTPVRAQLSFVRINATGDDLEACPVADIEGKVINYASVERKALEDLNEQDFLRGAITDVPSGSTVTRQVAYDNQGTSPVNLLTNATLDLEAAGITWAVRDDLEANLFRIVEGSAGGTSRIAVDAAVDFFDVDAVDNDFLNGIKVDTGAAGTTINVGVTANQIDAGGVLTVASGGGADLSLVAALELNLTDSYRAGSTWSLVDGISLADSSAEWSSFETAFGEVSLLNAIVQAKNSSSHRKVYATVTADVAADTNVSLGDTNLDVTLGDLSAGSFLLDYDIFHNGSHQYNGANAAANKDVYPGTSLVAGQLRFEKKLKTGDIIIVVDRAFGP
jgi:hypothetical protein